MFESLWDHLNYAFDLILAVVLGGLIGWDREKKHHPAGLRTHMMVSVGTAAVMISSLNYTELIQKGKAVELDPLRVVAGIIGGIGFLGAGAIMQSHGDVKGLTTAASIWGTAAVGICCGFSDHGLAIIATALMLFILKMNVDPPNSDPARE